MRLKLFLLMLLASTLALTAQTSALSGVVVNGTTGTPVGGVKVELQGTSALTGYNGDFTLDKLPTGKAYMIVTAEGYQPTGIDVEIIDGKLDLGTISLVPATDNVVEEYFIGSDDLMFDEAALDDEEGTSQGVSSLSGAGDNIYFERSSRRARLCRGQSPRGSGA